MTRCIQMIRRASAGFPLLEAAMALIMILSLSGPVSAADLGLIEPSTLSRDTSRWVILDARPRAEWLAGHIPGARSLCWEDVTRTDEKGVQFTPLPPGELAAALAALGIDEKTAVVVYGDADKSWGGEGYDVWLLSRLGHKGPVRLLNGGIQAWRGLNMPLVKGEEKTAVKKPRYQVEINPQVIIATEEIYRKKGSFALVDVRSTFEWFKGRIPGAVHIPWDDFYSGKERRPLTPVELKRLLARHGVDTSKPVVYYCLGGVRSAYAWMVHHLSGLPEARNYQGGWEAWRKRNGK